MRAWLRHRSVPAGALLVGTLALLSGAVAALALYLAVIRPGRGRAAATVGVSQSLLAHPARGVAAYAGVLVGPVERTTPAGHAAVAYAWRVFDPAQPDAVVCGGRALDALRLRDGAVERRLATPANTAALTLRHVGTVPPRVAPVCGDALVGARAAELRYEEQWQRGGSLIDAIGCVRGEGESATIDACDDQPLTLYPHVGGNEARRSARLLLPRLLLCAGSYAIVCILAALSTLRRFERTRVVRA